MRNFLAACLLACLLACLVLPACAPLAALSTEGGQTSASLGPDSVSATESASMLPERMEAAASEVWGWYTALKDKVDPAIEPMKRLYVAGQELVVAVQGKQWIKALAQATAAWALVDQIKGMVK